MDIAICLAHRPQILILDEVTSGLDPAMRIKIMNLLKKYAENENAAILFSTHIMADIEEIADVICLMEKGRLVLKEKRRALLDAYSIVKTELPVRKESKMFIEKGYYSAGYWHYLIREENKKEFLSYKLERASLDRIILFFLGGADESEGINFKRFNIDEK